MDIYKLAKKLNAHIRIIIEHERRIIDTVDTVSVILRSHIEDANIGDAILRSSAPLPTSYDQDIFEWHIKRKIVIRLGFDWPEIERRVFRKDSVGIGDEIIEYWLRVK